MGEFRVAAKANAEKALLPEMSAITEKLCGSRKCASRGRPAPILSSRLQQCKFVKRQVPASEEA